MVETLVFLVTPCIALGACGTFRVRDAPAPALALSRDEVKDEATQHSALSTQHSALSTLLALILLGSTRADARPLDYGSASCNPGGGTDVCTYDSVHDHWKCNLADITSGTTAATAWMIHGENDCDNICDGNPYCAFGVKNGVKFYCDLPAGAGAADDMVQGWLIGTPGADWLSFWYEEGTIKCVMENANLGVVSVVTGKILGNGGIGGDYICTDAGDDDIAYGGTGDDEIWDSTGTNDWIYGDDGTDSCQGAHKVSCEDSMGSRPPECPTETTPY